MHEPTRLDQRENDKRYRTYGNDSAVPVYRGGGRKECLTVTSNWGLVGVGIGSKTRSPGSGIRDVVHEVIGYQTPLVVVAGASRGGEINQVSRLEGGSGRCFDIWHQ